jgi:hypothetical protein
MNRWMNQFTYALDKGVTHLYCKITTFGAAPTFVGASDQKGFASIARQSTGDYLLTLSNPWVKLLNVTYCWDESSNSGSAPTAPILFVKAKTLSTVSGGTVEFITTTAAAGSATDPSTNEILMLDIVVAQSTAF